MLILAVALLYLVALIVLLLADIPIVRYHSRFWELTGRYFGLDWTLGHERALDDVVNVGLFVPLGFLVHRWWRRGSAPSWATAGATLAVMALLASSVEFIQRFLPWRYASLADVLADVLGAAIGVAVDTVLARSGSRSPRDPDPG
jgi:membrane protein YdbS with pleckstrin-like domain